MTDEQWDDYVKVLHVFIVTFPTKEMKLKSSMSSHDVDKTIKLLLEIEAMLRSIYANNLADECLNHLSSFDKTKP